MLRLGLILTLLTFSFGYRVFHSKPEGNYQMNYLDALEHCESLGAHLATRDELEEARLTNFSSCSCGWTLDKSAHLPMTSSHPDCGGSPGLHTCDWKDRWNAYCFSGDLIGNCSKPLGVETGKIRHFQIYASTEYDSKFPPFSNSRWMASIARLHNTDLVNAWIPKYNGRHQWLEVHFSEPTAVSGIVTQGASKLREKMWVTSFFIQYGKDRENFRYIQDDSGNELMFTGNSNNNGLKRNMFPEPILMEYLRFVPYGYHSRMALRFELLGCDLETYRYGKALARDMEVIEISPDEK